MVFGDTSAIVAYFDGNDQRHNESKRIFDKIVKERIKILVTDYIFDECITTILSRVGHYNALKAGEFILSSGIIKFVWLDECLKLKAWEYFEKHSDKSYSFTDCTSFVVMKEMKVNHFFAFDDHFVKAGFVAFSSR
jgi:predicted nucleic acid-binding protein